MKLYSYKERAEALDNDNFFTELSTFIRNYTVHSDSLSEIAKAYKTLKTYVDNHYPLHHKVMQRLEKE